MKKIIGFYGAGKMAEGIVQAVAAAGSYDLKEVVMAESYQPRAKEMAKRYRVKTVSDVEQAAKEADAIFLSVKPQDVAAVAERVKPLLTSKKLVVSIVAGKSLATLRKMFGAKVRLVRVMPNLALKANAGMCAIAPARGVSKDVLAAVEKILSGAGRTVILPEKHFDAVTALSGSGPAYFAYMMKMMAEGGVALGLKKSVARLLAEQTMYGTAKFLREFLSVNANFAYYYAEDGYCDEGPVYYSKAGLKLFSSLNLLHKIRPGSMDKLFAVPRVRAIFEYIAHVGIGNNHVVNYGDNGPRSAKDVNVAICGEVLKSDLMKGLNNKDSKFYLGSNANYLNNGLQLLFDLPELQNNQKYVHPMSLFKDRLVILRTNGFSVAVKAGHNGEAHNHNDLGNVTVYFKNQPIIIDAGNGAYSRINFSDKRYTLWYTRGSGHNAPVFGNVEQMVGKHYSAKFIRADLKNVTVDLGKAYPKELPM